MRPAPASSIRLQSVGNRRAARATTLRRTARTVELLTRIERPILFGQLLSGCDVAHRHLKVVADTQAIRITRVIVEAGVVPAQNVVTPAVDVGVFLDGSLA